MAARTYMTKKEGLEFAQYILSDERKLIHLNRMREMVAKGLDPQLVTPYSVTLKTVTKQDYTDWTLQGESRVSESVEAFNLGVISERKRWITSND